MRSPLLMLLRESGAPVTLDDWLSASDCDNTFDAELLEVIPAEFRDEYNDRLRLNSYYERKFAEQTAVKRAGRAQTGSKRWVSVERVSKP